MILILKPEFLLIFYEYLMNFYESFLILKIFAAPILYLNLKTV